MPPVLRHRTIEVVFSDLQRRLRILETTNPAGTSSTGGPPSGPASGSLAGTYPSPEIAADAVGAVQISAGAVGASEMAATITKGLDFAATVSPFGLRSTATSSITTGMTRTDYDYGNATRVDFAIDSAGGSWMTSVANRGPSAVHQVYGTIQMNEDIGLLGQGVAVQNFLTYKNGPLNAGSAFSTSWGSVNYPWHFAQYQATWFHHEIGVTTTPVGGFWDATLLKGIAGGLIDGTVTSGGDPVDAAGYVGSEVSKLFTGNPSDRAMWMIGGGVVLTIGGIAGFAVGSKKG